MVKPFMSRLSRSALLLAGLTGLASLPVPPAAADGVDRIVAVVEDDVILESELQKKIAAIRQGLAQSDTPMPSGITLARQVLDRMILHMNRGTWIEEDPDA